MKRRRKKRTTIISDFDVVIKIYLLQKDYTKALEVISIQADPKLYYKYAEDMFEHMPQEFVAALINAGRLIRPGRVIECTKCPEIS